MARPSTFSQETADAICDRLAVGQSLREICRDEAMPGASTVFQWLAKHEKFAEQYARAKSAGIEALAEDILEIADDATNDWMERNGEKGESIGWQLNGEAVRRSQIRIDARKWLLSKLAAKKYGDRVEQSIQGPGGGPVQVSEIRRTIIDPKADGGS